MQAAKKLFSCFSLCLAATAFADDLPIVSSVSLGHPSVAIIDGKIRVEGEMFAAKGHNYRLKGGE